MKTAIGALCTLFLLTTSFVFSQTPAGSTPQSADSAAAPAAMAGTNGDPVTETNLQKMENELAQGDVARDSAPFNKYLDDDIVALGPGWSFHGKAELVKDVQSGPCTITNPALTSFAYKWISADVVLVSYKLNQTVTCNGKTTQSAEHANSLWQRKNGKWLAVFHQSTADMPMSGGS